MIIDLNHKYQYQTHASKESLTNDLTFLPIIKVEILKTENQSQWNYKFMLWFQKIHLEIEGRKDNSQWVIHNFGKNCQHIRNYWKMCNKIEKDKVQLQTCLKPWAPTTNRKMTVILVMCNAHDSLNSTDQVSHVQCIWRETCHPNLFQSRIISRILIL